MAKEGLGESGVGALCPNHVEGGLMKRWCLRRENSAQNQTASVHDLTDSSSSRRRARGSRAEVDTAGCSIRHCNTSTLQDAAVLPTRPAKTGRERFQFIPIYF